MKKRYLFISFNVREEERVHNHRVLIETKKEDLNDAVQSYLKTFWGDSEEYPNEPGIYYACGEKIAIYLDKFKELSKEKYDEMYAIFYH